MVSGALWLVLEPGKVGGCKHALRVPAETGPRNQQVVGCQRVICIPTETGTGTQ